MFFRRRRRRASQLCCPWMMPTTVTRVPVRSLQAGGGNPMRWEPTTGSVWTCKLQEIGGFLFGYHHLKNRRWRFEIPPLLSHKSQTFTNYVTISLAFWWLPLSPSNLLDTLHRQKNNSGADEARVPWLKTAEWLNDTVDGRKPGNQLRFW